jgi:glutamate synthase (NADPH) small chain
LLPQPPKSRPLDNPWPEWPMTLRTSSSHEEGCERDWAVLTKEFVGDKHGNLAGVKCVNIEWKAAKPGERAGFVEIDGTERIIPCELALLAVGFVGPEKEGLVDQLKVTLDERGTVAATDYKTSLENVFAAGDLRRGQSLVVWAISEGREAARAIDIHLMGSSDLEAKDASHISELI